MVRWQDQLAIGGVHVTALVGNHVIRHDRFRMILVVSYTAVATDDMVWDVGGDWNGINLPQKAITCCEGAHA